MLCLWWREAHRSCGIRPDANPSEKKNTQLLFKIGITGSVPQQGQSFNGFAFSLTVWCLCF